MLNVLGGKARYCPRKQGYGEEILQIGWIMDVVELVAANCIDLGFVLLVGIELDCNAYSAKVVQPYVFVNVSLESVNVQILGIRFTISFR